MATLGRPILLASLRDIEPLHLPQAPSTTAALQVNHCHGAHLSSSTSFCPQWHPLFSAAGSRQPGREEISQARSLRVYAARSKGFGDLVRKSKQEAQGKKAAPNACPCGGGKDLKEYGECCGPFHGGVVEPDALTLMKARFSAYSLGVVPYVVRTTHPDNPAFEGAEKLAEDVRATCGRLRFFKLELLDFKEVSESENEVVCWGTSKIPCPNKLSVREGESKERTGYRVLIWNEHAFVSFVAHYTLVKGGRGGERKQLNEESRFVREDGRWLYREGLVTQASEAAWMAATTPNYVEPEDARKAFASSRAPIAAQANKTSPRGF